MKLIATASALLAHVCLFTAVAGSDNETSIVVTADGTTDTQLRGRNKEFRNWSRDYGVGGPYEKMFVPKNSIDGMQSEDFLTGLEHIKNAVAQALADGKKLRAFGSAFSMINVHYTKEYLLDSRELEYFKIGIDDERYLQPSYVAKKKQLTFVQSGVMIRRLNKVLLKAGLALPSASMPDGTRFVGAMSTSAHGSHHTVGGMESYVKALHIVIPGNHYLIQMATDPVVTTDYSQYLGGATLLNNDDLFRAALTSFGSFGVIHGVILEADPLFKLKYKARTYDYDTIKPAMATLTVSMLKGMEDLSDRPFYMDFVLNPYRLNQKGVLVRTQEKVFLNPADLEQGIILTEEDEDIPEDPEMKKNLVKFGLLATQSLLRPVSKFFMGLFVQVMELAFSGAPLSGRTLYPGQIYTFPGAQLKKAPFFLRNYYEMGVMVPWERAPEAVDIIMKLLNDHPVPFIMGVRYVKQTKALLGTTQYEITAAVTLVGFYYRFLPYFRQSDAGFKRIFDAMEASDIPHTYAWGKQFPINKEWVAKGYGDKLTQWKAQRASFLGPEGLYMFTNELMESIGITY